MLQNIYPLLTHARKKPLRTDLRVERSFNFFFNVCHNSLPYTVKHITFMLYKTTHTDYQGIKGKLQNWSVLIICLRKCIHKTQYVKQDLNKHTLAELKCLICVMICFHLHLTKLGQLKVISFEPLPCIVRNNNLVKWSNSPNNLWTIEILNYNSIKHHHC